MATTTHEGRRLIRLPEVKKRTGKSKSGIYDGIRSGTFPAPIAIGARGRAWLSDEITSWINDRIRVSRGEEAVAE